MQRSAQSRALGLAGGGRGRGRRPRGQRWLPGYEGSDAGAGHRGWQLGRHPCGCRSGPVSRAWFAVLCVVAQTVWRLRGEALFAPRTPGSLTGPPAGAVGCRIRCARVCICAPRVGPRHSGVWPVRRLHSSINIATFPGRKTRTVSRFNLSPHGATREAPRPLVPGRPSQRSERVSRPLSSPPTFPTACC